MAKYSKAGKALIDSALAIYNKLKAVAKDPDNLKGTAAERKSMQASQDKAVVSAKKKLDEARVKARTTPEPKSKPLVAKTKEEAIKEDKAKKSIKTGEKVKFSKNYNVQEGMGLDAVTGRDVRAAADVDKGKAGKVTRSAEPGFLQQERTAGSRAKAQEKVDLAKKVRDGEATKAEKAKLKSLREKDAKDTASARAKGAASRKKKSKATLPELKSAPSKKVTKEKPPINLKTGEINMSVFNKLSPGKQEQAVRNAMARVEGPRKRELKAMLDNIAPTKAGETGVRARKGGPKGMSGATAKNIKDIDEGVGGRGGLDFNRGGMPRKRMGSMDYRKGGMVKASYNNKRGK